MPQNRILPNDLVQKAFAECQGLPSWKSARPSPATCAAATAYMHIVELVKAVAVASQAHRA